ncbi:MAG: hypothetical protein ACFFCO_07450, partial [Promethearchaeota archaeon]
KGEFPLSMNIMIHGSFGVGRTTLLRFFGHHELGGYCRPLISFQMKSTTEIVRDTLQILTGTTPQTDVLSELWVYLKRILQKAETPIIFNFDDVDRTSQVPYTKFLALCKEFGIPSMTTSPRFFPRQLPPTIIQNLDHSIELEPFSDNQFLDIITQRVVAAFPNPLPSAVLEFMADIICTLDFQRPATVVELLRSLYPIISKGTIPTAETVRQACLSSKTLHYDFWDNHLASLADLDITTALLLQGIGEFFLSNPGRLYIDKQNLITQYNQVCERNEIPQSSTQFSRALNDVLFQDLLIRSRYNSQNYFTLLPAQGYLDIVDLLLAATEDC